MGDLNTSPWSPIFRKMLKKGQLKDTRAYRGYYATWPSLLESLGIPIDHALINDKVQLVHRCVLNEGNGSDHRPIMIEIR